MQLLNSSAAFVSWLPPILPIGIRLVNYTIYHVRVVYGGESSNTRIQNSTFLVDHGTVGQLDSDQLYEFWGEAVIKETDGSTTIGAITQRNATIFIPGKWCRISGVFCILCCKLKAQLTKENFFQLH